MVVTAYLPVFLTAREVLLLAELYDLALAVCRLLDTQEVGFKGCFVSASVHAPVLNIKDYILSNYYIINSRTNIKNERHRLGLRIP